MNRDIIKGKYFSPDFPKLSWTTERMLTWINSMMDCHLFGINLSPFNNNQTTMTTKAIIRAELVKVINQSPQKACIVIKAIILNWSKYALNTVL